MKKFFSILFCSLILASCKNTTQPDKQITTSPEIPVPTSVVNESAITEVKVQSDTTQSYTLYAPSKADSNFLILVFFDPGAKGNKPVELYQSLADKHHIILAGSNSSKNGLSGEQSVAIAKKLVQDLRSRFLVKQNNIYASGFSGGGRVAVLAAISENLPGAIGCGAGFPGKVEKNYGFNYIGVVGNEDFNFLEMKRLYSDLERVKMKHQLIVFDGKHEWCPPDQMEKAILLLRNDAASKQLLAARIDSAVAVFKAGKQWLRLYDELRLGITSGLDSANVNAWKKELHGLKKNAACLAELKQEAMIETLEAETQTEIARAFPARDFALLASKIKALSQNAKQPPLQKLADKRLLQFVSLMGFLYSEKSLDKDVKLAKQYLDVYGKADPENQDYHYLMASYYVKTGDKTKAMTSLKKAIELGFDDDEKIRNNATLSTLQNEPGFSELMQQAALN